MQHQDDINWSVPMSNAGKHLLRPHNIRDTEIAADAWDAHCGDVGSRMMIVCFQCTLSLLIFFSQWQCWHCCCGTHWSMIAMIFVDMIMISGRQLKLYFITWYQLFNCCSFSTVWRWMQLTTPLYPELGFSLIARIMFLLGGKLASNPISLGESNSNHKIRDSFIFLSFGTWRQSTQ